MNSRISLFFKDKTLNDAYVIRRSREIVINSSVLLAARVMLIMGTAIATL